MAIGGEQEEQVKSFKNQARVMLMSTVMIGGEIQVKGQTAMVKG
jgi:hypothetical protein